MYNFKGFEKKWQNYWDSNNTFNVDNNSSKPKFYYLIEYPYPSGVGLHVGHIRSYTALDAMARVKRMKGYNVLYPIGWDAFGLPAEQYAIKNHIHPKKAVEENIATFKKQIKSLGISFDWSREFSTTDPDYYKWTQWQFLLFYNNNMAYKAKKEINWCPNCKIGLSNEEAEGNVCERCNGSVIKKEKDQWMLKMSVYADRLLDGLKDTDFTDRIKIAQENWIGKSEGAEVIFKVKEVNDYLKVFTTRCDTLFGVTFMVISPEHDFLDKYKNKITNYEEVKAYQKQAAIKTIIERTNATKEKTGIKIIGLTAINPVNNQEIPIYISDYVLKDYGTGVIMAVPGHDERDYEFAKKFKIEIIPVIEGKDITHEPNLEDGIHINSDFINGLDKNAAINKMLEYLKENKIGDYKVNYRLQDWVFSRQRFWGEPIPMIKCSDCGWVAVPFDQLPVTLPEVVNYEPTDDGESPLANIESWVNTTCPKCGNSAKRETDTMPNWAGSSWYWLRYMDPHNNEEFASLEAMKYWGMVDYYNGGMEHTTRHLLYARFWNKFLFDLGLVPNDEPFKKRVSHGMILGDNGEKMSKSRGNVVNPDDMIEMYGADALRCYEMFIGDYIDDVTWSENGLKGCKRFLDKVYSLKDKINNLNEYTNNLEILINQTIKKVSEDIENMKYNTAVSSLMILTNNFDKETTITKKDYRTLLQLLNPIAPHLTEELNQELNLGEELSISTWPDYDVNKLTFAEITIGVQINGKLRSSIKINLDEEEIEVKRLALEAVNNRLIDQEVIKVIVVKNKIVNILVK